MNSYAQLKPISEEEPQAFEREPSREVVLEQAFERQASLASGRSSLRGSIVFQAAAQLQAGPRKQEKRSRIAAWVGLTVWVVLGLLAYMSGYVVVGPEGKGLTVVQSLYLMAQIISTIGYGDYVPKTAVGQLFVIFHILYAGLLITGMVTEVMDWFVHKHAEAAGGVVHGFFEAADDHTGDSYRELLGPVLQATLFFIIAVAVWALFFMYFCDIFHVDKDEAWDGLHDCEAMSTVDALYFAVVTMTTLGFGDITPHTAGGEAFACIFSLVGIAAYLNLVGAVTNSFLKVKEKIKMDRITQEELEQADEDGTGNVDLFEFTRFILTKFNVVEKKVFRDIKLNFKHLDRDGSGFLERRDLEVLMDKYDERTGHRMEKGRRNSLRLASGEDTDEPRPGPRCSFTEAASMPD